jgi:MFS transporter, SP family, xylose:H+ symportor
MHAGTSAASSPVAEGQCNARYVGLISGVAALGGLLFGYDWVVIGGAKPFYEKYFDLTSEQLIGWANSCALLGCLLGSLLSGAVSDRLGRKKMLIASAALFAVSSVATGWATTFAAFILWRIIGGVAIGIASNVSPTYIAEVSPPSLRGRLVSLNQLTIVVGILLAQLVNWMIADRVVGGASAEMIRSSWNGQFGWRWMFTAVAVPAAVFFAGSFFVPESPRWLAQRGLRDSAREVLKRIGGASYAESALREIDATLAADRNIAAGWSELFQPSLLRILGIGIFLAVLQQWSGINVIFNYAEEIYRSAGYGVSDILFNIVITGTINLVFTMVALGFVDRFGRLPLMLFGCGGIACSHFLIGVAYRMHATGLPLLIFTLCTIGCYAMSLAPITWVLISEIYPNRVRGLAVSVTVSALWIASFVLTFTFPIINRLAGPSATFWLYGLVCVTGFFFILKLVPETKGRSLEEIEQDFRHRLPRRPHVQ